MPSFKIKNIVFIGSGNVATHLALSFAEKGFIIKQVYSRTIQNAKILADRINAHYTNVVSEIFNDSDLYVLAVTDNAVAEIVSQIDIQNKLIVHTSGSLEINALEKFANYGVFYPLQTFSKNIVLDFGNVPLLIEANNNKNHETLMKLATYLTSKVYAINSEKRKQVHLAAVFACNFSNHMYSIAEKILSHSDISFDIIRPLINETALKIKNQLPCCIQTGPAVRNDQLTIEKHLTMLNTIPEYKKIYKLLTTSIKKERKNIENNYCYHD